MWQNCGNDFFCIRNEMMQGFCKQRDFSIEGCRLCKDV